MDRSFFALQGAQQLSGTAESTTKFHFMPFKLRMQGGGLYMRISIGVKRVQAQRHRVPGNPPALDRHRHRLILGYATDPLTVTPPTPRTHRYKLA